MLKNKKTTKIARVVIEHTANFGAAFTVAAAIKGYIPMHKNKLVRVSQNIGTFGLSGVAGNAASKYVVEQFDNVVDVIDSF